MAVADVAVVRLVGRYQSQNIVNTLHYRITSQTEPELFQWQVLADDWLAANGALWLGEHVDSYTLEGIKVFTRKGVSRPPGFTSSGASGTVVGTPQDALVCRTITQYTASGNHRIRGRLQLSGGDTAMFDADTGEVTAAAITDLDLLGAQLLATIAETSTEFNLVLYNKLLDRTEDVVLLKGRVTPSVVRSRRAKQFTLG